MNVKDILSQKVKFLEFLNENRFHDAFSLLLGLSESMMFWEITDRIKAVRDDYRRMIAYALKGAEDNTRGIFIESMKEVLATIFNQIVVRKKLLENSYELHLNTFRNIAAGNDNLSDALASYADNVESLEKKEDFKQINDIAKRIFNLVWVSPSLGKEDLESICNLLVGGDNRIADPLLGALMLREITNGVEANVLTLLLKVYSNSQSEFISVKALSLFVLLCLFYDRQLPVLRLQKELERMPAGFTDNLQTVVLEILRTLETDRINQKMREEILPNMIKMGPKIKERFKNLDEEELLNIEENPEWMEMMESSGLADSLKEMTQLQMEGADVMMSTFGNMKNFPFFSDLYNWFVPFTLQNQELAAVFPKNDALRKLLERVEILCDSDKFSLAFSLASLPAEQQQLMAANIEEQSRAMNEMMTSGVEEVPLKFLVGRYIKNLYRFFKLFRRKAEFPDLFDNIMNPVKSNLLRPYIAKKEFLLVLAEFYMKQQAWDDAFTVYAQIESTGAITAQLYQKMGFCKQKTGDFDKALNYYMHAEVLDPENAWTMRRIAYCARKVGKWSTAVEYYEALNKLSQDDIKLAMALGKCLMEIANFEQASKIFFKAYYLKPDSQQVIRALARAMIMKGDIETAQKYISKLDSNDIESLIFLGHHAFISKNYEDALNKYIEAARKGSMDLATLLQHIENDREMLVADASRAEIYPLMKEELAYSVPIPLKR